MKLKLPAKYQVYVVHHDRYSKVYGVYPSITKAEEVRDNVHKMTPRINTIMELAQITCIEFDKMLTVEDLENED